jgi:putative ABC transport system permease protein
MQHLSALALRNVRTRPSRTLLTAAGIILGVAVVVGISIANQSIYAGFEALFADVAGAAHLTVQTASSNEDGFDQRLLEQVRGVEGVSLAVPSTANDTMLLLGDREIALTVYGVDPETDARVRPYRMVKGNFLSAARQYTAIIVEDLSTEHGLEVGENMTLLGAEGPEQVLVVGIMAKEGPARRAQIVVPLTASQDIFARRGRIDAIDIIAEEAIAQSASTLDRLKATLQDKVGVSYEVLYPAARAKTITEALEGISLGLSFFAATALFGGAYLIFNTFSMTVVERMREIGMLRAVGATKGQNFRLILTEAFILGLAGSLLGVLFGLLLSVAMTHVLSAPFGLTEWTFSVPPGGIVAGLVVGMVVTIGGALIPAIRASRISPIEALAVRGTSRKAGWLIRHGWKVGLALVLLSESASFIPIPEDVAQMGFHQMTFLLLMAGVTLLVPLVTRLLERLARPVIALIYGTEGRIGGSNVNRALGRTTVTAGALTMGVLMLIVIGAQSTSMTSDVRAWMHAAMQGDLFVNSYQPMRLALGEELATIEGVAGITPTRYQQTKVAGTTTHEGFTPQDNDIAFVAVEPLEYIQISEFDFASGQGDGQAMVERLVEGNAVFISTMIGEKYDIGKGDAIRLRTSRGEQDFTVAGVIVDYTWGGWSVTGSWRDLQRYFRTDKADVFVVDVAPGADVNQVQQRMEDQYGKRRHIEVASGQDYRERWLKEFMSVMAFFDIIVGIGIVIGALGVTNTMTMNVLERIREIGCLRAVGMTRRQVVRMVLAEALIIGILGGLFGVAFGTYVAYFAVQGMEQGAGWELDFVLPTSLLFVGLAIALGISQLASLYPAWRATKVNIVRAVQYE